MDLPESRAIQSCDHPSAASSLGSEKLRPEQGGASWDQTRTKTLSCNDKIRNYLFWILDVKMSE